MEAQQKQITSFIVQLVPASVQCFLASLTTSIPSFASFDAASVLWKDYWARLKTFGVVNFVPSDKLAQGIVMFTIDKIANIMENQ
ncbi:hypothetical protein T07_5314 [Trichinella nelsoni]|uniref:Uncharacterized protein n=1 Tax=Trichinella nelsoni TaxID=6336 RepID=A0A0V0S115_9BILA|nr:hypothetical protein T07_5314 [Trichinella nelsoni]